MFSASPDKLLLTSLLLAAAPGAAFASPLARVHLEPAVAPARASSAWTRASRAPAAATLELIAHLRHSPAQRAALEEHFWPSQTQTTPGTGSISPRTR